MDTQEWTLRRNCSITPRQLMLVYAVLCAASFTIAGIFALRGAWYILGFAIAEMSAVGCAFVLFARHATDRERIALHGDCLLIEVIRGEEVKQFKLNPHYAKVAMPTSGDEPVGIEAGGVCVEVGRFLTRQKRCEFARELKRALASAS